MQRKPRRLRDTQRIVHSTPSLHSALHSVVSHRGTGMALANSVPTLPRSSQTEVFGNGLTLRASLRLMR